MLTLVAIEAVAIVALGLLVLGLLRSHAEILRRLHDLGAGLDPDATADVAVRPPGRLAPAPAASGVAGADVTGTSITDEPVSIGVVGARNDTLLAFLTTGCLTCVGFWDVLRDHRALAVPGGARLVVVAKGPDQESPSRLRELAPDDGPVVRSNEAWEHYRVPVAPYFVYVDGPSGRVIGEGAGQTWKQVTSLLAQALSDAETAGGRARGATSSPVAPAGRRLDRESRSDRELAEAGIVPGHPSLYPSPPSASPARDD
ncbi:MAG: TlpA family protein disulfide reductase [Acidimicrobiales bacterium]